eukprot:TRINITY_DN3589_c0_g1_i2.p1 TRINITY_DN3589_c0_g1~~TRINITY_DN3589_c0_g1_i2.p1  ORF type:complete len:585 (+),score=97.06 TRINITY_DN3589_c0_g1_i2:55-1809(+)
MAAALLHPPSWLLWSDSCPQNEEPAAEAELPSYVPEESYLVPAVPPAPEPEPIGCARLRVDDVWGYRPCQREVPGRGSQCGIYEQPLTRDGHPVGTVRLEVFDVDPAGRRVVPSAHGCSCLKRRYLTMNWMLFLTTQGGVVQVGSGVGALSFTHNNWPQQMAVRVEVVVDGAVVQVVFTKPSQARTSFDIKLHEASALLSCLRQLAFESGVPLVAANDVLVPGALPLAPGSAGMRRGMRVLSVSRDGAGSPVHDAWCMMPEAVTLRCRMCTGSFTFSSSTLHPDIPGTVWPFTGECHDVTGAGSVWMELHGSSQQVAATIPADSSVHEDELRRYSRRWLLLSLAFGVASLPCALSNGRLGQYASNKTVLAYMAHCAGCVVHDAVALCLHATAGAAYLLPPADSSTPTGFTTWVCIAVLLVAHFSFVNAMHSDLRARAFRNDPGPRHAIGVLHSVRENLPMWVEEVGERPGCWPAAPFENELVAKRLARCRWITRFAGAVCAGLFVLGAALTAGGAKQHWVLGVTAGALLYFWVVCRLVTFAVSLVCALHCGRRRERRAAAPTGEWTASCGSSGGRGCLLQRRCG